MMDMNPGAGSDIHEGNNDVFLIKFKNSGAFQWARTFGGSGLDSAYGVAVDELGGVYLCGYFNYTVDFDAGSGVDNHTSQGDHDSYLVKYDSTGTFMWARTWGGSERDTCQGIATTYDGNVYVVGYFQDMGIDFDPGTSIDLHSSNGMRDAFVSKFDSDGNFQWAKTWGGPDGNDYSYKIALDEFGYLYLTGAFTDTVDFDPAFDTDIHIAQGISDGYLSRFDTSGNHSWTRTWGDPTPTDGSTEATGVAADSIGNCYVTGSFTENMALTAGSGVYFAIDSDSYYSDIFFARWSPSGNLDWGRHLGGLGNDKGVAMSLDSAGNPFAAGTFEWEVEFAPTEAPCNNTSYNLVSNGDWDMFVTMMHPDGCW